jgi:hypothetical protein
MFAVLSYPRSSHRLLWTCPKAMAGGCHPLCGNRLSREFAKIIVRANELRCLAPEVPRPNHASALDVLRFSCRLPNITAEGQLKLIEINTNASMSLLLDVLNCEMHVGRCLKEDFLDDFAEDLGRSSERNTKVVYRRRKSEVSETVCRIFNVQRTFPNRAERTRLESPTEPISIFTMVACG